MILLRVSLFFIVLLLLPDWYIYKVYMKYIQHKWQKRLYWLPTVLLLMVLLVFIVAHDSLHDAFGIYLIVTLCVAVPKLVFVLCTSDPDRIYCICIFLLADECTGKRWRRCFQ